MQWFLNKCCLPFKKTQAPSKDVTRQTSPSRNTPNMSIRKSNPTVIDPTTPNQIKSPMDKTPVKYSDDKQLNELLDKYEVYASKKNMSNTKQANFQLSQSPITIKTNHNVNVATRNMKSSIEDPTSIQNQSIDNSAMEQIEIDVKANIIKKAESQKVLSSEVINKKDNIESETGLGTSENVTNFHAEPEDFKEEINTGDEIKIDNGNEEITVEVDMDNGFAHKIKLREDSSLNSSTISVQHSINFDKKTIPTKVFSPDREEHKVIASNSNIATEVVPVNEEIKVNEEEVVVSVEKKNVEVSIECESIKSDLPKVHTPQKNIFKKNPLLGNMVVSFGKNGFKGKSSFNPLLNLTPSKSSRRADNESNLDSTPNTLRSEKTEDNKSRNMTPRKYDY